ncbi:MAG: hypothetical protein KDK78_08930 [Chlamydiia bacterium]|nr:hypothetical protein [Chlamydiia bacterium]
MKIATTCILAALFLLQAPLASAQSISDKLKSFSTEAPQQDSDSASEARTINDTLSEKHKRLIALQQEAQRLFDSGANEAAFEPIRREILSIRNDLRDIEDDWKARTTEHREEEYALWYQPETTLGQLVVDYGDRNFIYLIPPEIAQTKVSISSSLPIPAESWGGMLELLLVSKGIGIRQVNPFLKELYVLNESVSGIERITDRREDLDLVSESKRIAFVVSPPPKEVNNAFHLLKRFTNEKNTSSYLANRQIYIVGFPKTIQELLKLYDFVGAGVKGSDYRLVPVAKMSAEEMATILRQVFEETEVPKEGMQPGPGTPIGGLVIMPLTTLPHSLFLMGTPRDIEQAVEIITDLESQVGDIKEKTLYHYHVKHAEAEELATILERIYAMMVGENLAEPTDQNGPSSSTVEVDLPPLPPRGEYLRGVEPQLRVNPSRVEPGVPAERAQASNLKNFIVDPKTGSIVMVVEREYLPRLQSLLRRLDVPTKMVQIEVLLVEHRATKQQDYGLNLLRLGDCASSDHTGCMRWNDSDASGASGIVEFLFSRPRQGDFPAFDLGLKFLLSQENVVINSAPSVTTLNQTPATIHVVEEISLNTGVVELDTTRDTTVKDAFVRAQYGITIEVTPTVHLAAHDAEDEEGYDYITMETKITFDEAAASSSDPSRPDILRRNVINTVRVADGESLIVGGLRNKNSTDSKDSVPYLCEIPGLGKLFGTDSLTDRSTEMFIFITPRIVGPCDTEASELRRCVQCDLPGEGPTYFRLISEGKDFSRQKLRQEGLKALLAEGDAAPSREAQPYDGR